jgi:hypothetical protein
MIVYLPKEMLLDGNRTGFFITTTTTIQYYSTTFFIILLYETDKQRAAFAVKG